jgi:hypothetical protein
MKNPDRGAVDAAARQVLRSVQPGDAQAFSCAPVVTPEMYGTVLGDRRFAGCSPEKVYVTFEAIFNEPGVPIANIRCKDGRLLDVVFHDVDQARCPATNTTGFVVSSIQLVSVDPKQILFMLPPNVDTALPEKRGR